MLRSFFPTLLSNGVTSFVNLFVTVIVGRQEGVYELGIFGIGMACIGLAQLVCREVGINVAWANKYKSAETDVTFIRSSTTAIVIASVLAIISLIISSSILAMLCIVLVGYILYDYVRLWEISQGRPRAVLVSDSVLWLVVTSSGIIVLVFDFSSVWLVITWACVYPCLLWALLRRRKYKFTFHGLWEKDGWSFGAQALLGSGSVHISTFLLALVVSPVLVGEVRAATTIFGLVNIVSVTMQSVIIHSISGMSDRRSVLLRWVGMSLMIQGILAILTVAFGIYFGPWMFGGSWANSGSLLPWLALDTILVAIGVAAVAAHKVDRIAINATWIAITAGVLRMAFVPAMGLFGGSVGVVIALCCVSAMATILWWLSYNAYRRTSF